MHNLETVKATIRGVITQQSGYTTFGDDDLLSSFGIDSLTTIEIVMLIEDQYEISIELADIGKGRFTLTTLADIVLAKL